MDVYQTQGCTRYWKRGQDDCCWLLNPTCTPTMRCSGDAEWPHPKFDGPSIKRVASRALELGNEAERPLTRPKSSKRVRKCQKRYLLESMRWLPDATDSFSSHKYSLRHTTNVQSATSDGECLHKNARRLLGDVRSKSEVNAQKYKFKCVWKVGISTLYECQTHSR